MPMQPSPTTSPLDQLADIHLPDPVGWWPLAPGWWLLLALAIVAAIIYLLARRRAAMNRYRKLARAELDNIYSAYQADQDAAMFLQNISVLLRRTALTAYPQTFNASIKGQAWLEWLDGVNPPKKTDPNLRFSSEVGQAFISASYQKTPTVNAPAIHQLCAHWIEHHSTQHQKTPAPKPVKTAEANHV